MKPGWAEKRLIDFCVLQRGFDLPKKQRKPGVFPLISSSGSIDFHSEAKVLGPGVVTGRSGSIGHVFFVESDFWPLNTALYVKDFKGNDPRFVSYLLESFDLERYTSGAGVPTLNRNHVHEEKVLIPVEVEEQKRIVAILDQAFADIDKARALTEQNLKNARELFESYLQQVFSQRGEGWVKTALGDLAEINYGYTEKASFEADGPRFLRITDIQDGNVVWDQVPFCPISDKDYEKHKLVTGDIVFARTGATTGKSYLLYDPPDAVAASYLIRLRLGSERVLPEFVKFFFQTKAYWDLVNAGMSGSAQGGFNASKLSALKVSYPEDIGTQRKFVGELSSVGQAIEDIEATYLNKSTLLEELKKSLLQKAFSGELTKASTEVAA